MDDYFLAALFEKELDVMKEQGEKSLRQDKHAQLEPALQAAKVCLSTDFAPESQIRTKLLEELLAKFSRRNGKPTGDMPGDYEEDRELD